MAKRFDIAVDCFKLTEDFPSEQKFALTSQINRSGVSIPSNIAEGSSRSSEKDYNRFLEISLGSCFELETQLLISQAVKYGDNTMTNKILANIDEEEKMMMSFMNKLNK
jgi:four helix bundle protein